jgi:hypothetical protein
MEEKITNEMIMNCLKFIQRLGGEVSRYAFDHYITRNIMVIESFNIVPKILLDKDLIDIKKDGGETKVVLTKLGIDKITH